MRNDPLGRRRLLLGGLGVGFGVIVAACGGPASTPTRTSSATRSPQAPVGTTASDPAKPSATAPAKPAAVLDPRTDPIKGPSIGYGMNVWLYNHEQTDRVLGLVRDAGFGWARQWVPWSEHEPEKAKMRFGELDPIVDAALRNKVR